MKKLLIIPAMLLASTAYAAPKISAQSIIVNPTQPDLAVSVNVDKDVAGTQNPSYRAGENIRVSASVNRDAYVYLFNVDSTGEVTQILPNRLQGGGNFVKANTTAVFPAPGSGFTFTVDGQPGLNKVLALASLTELNLDQISTFKTAQDQFATVKAKGQDGLAQALSIPVIASGGLSNLADIEKLCAVESEGVEGVICGRAIYSGDLDFAAAEVPTGDGAPVPN